MTNEQLYLAIGVPAALCVLLTTVILAYINVKFASIDGKFDAVNQRFEGVNQRFDAIDKRFDDMRDLWRSELRRVEEVLDGRLKHLEH